MSSLALTFDEELAALERSRVTPQERQAACVAIVQRHLEWLTLTDVLLMQHFEHRLYCDLALRGKRWNHAQQCEEDTGEGALMPVVHMRSLVRAKGKAQPIKGIKVGPPYPGNKSQNKQRDVKGMPRYPTKDFEVDPETGNFKVGVPIEMARTILATHGAHVRYPRYSTRYPAGYSHRAPDPNVKPFAVDEWIFGEARFLDRGVAEPAKTSPVTIMAV